MTFFVGSECDCFASLAMTVRGVGSGLPRRYAPRNDYFLFFVDLDCI